MKSLLRLFTKQSPTLYLLEDTHDSIETQQYILENVSDLVEHKGVNALFLENFLYGKEIPREKAIYAVDQRLTILASAYLRAKYDEETLAVIGTEDPEIFAKYSELLDRYLETRQEYQRIISKHGMEGASADNAAIQIASSSIPWSESKRLKDLSNMMVGFTNQIIKGIPERNKGMASNIKREIKKRKIKKAAFICGSSHYHRDPNFGRLFSPKIHLQLIPNSNKKISRPIEYNDAPLDQ